MVNILGISFKECAMTVVIHDYAFPKPFKWGLFGLGEPIQRQPITTQIFGTLTNDTIKHMSNESLGHFVRELFNKVQESKHKIESETVSL